MSFIDKLLAISRRNKSLLCVGLDPDPALMPQVNMLEFLKAIVDATKDFVCAYKPNFAFYETHGLEGTSILEQIIKYIPDDIPVIGDAKRGDIGNTARAYASAVLDRFGCDAVTISPYLGFDSVEPFLNHKDKGIFILCRTSNKGAHDFQDIVDSYGKPLYVKVAEKALEWNTQGNIGLVVGATYPEELEQIRKLCPDMPLLIPGIGAQGGDLELAIKNGIDARGEKAVINVSRQVLYASSEKDFARAAGEKAREICREINDVLDRIKQKP